MNYHTWEKLYFSSLYIRTMLYFCTVMIFLVLQRNKNTHIHTKKETIIAIPSEHWESLSIQLVIRSLEELKRSWNYQEGFRLVN